VGWRIAVATGGPIRCTAARSKVSMGAVFSLPWARLEGLAGGTRDAGRGPPF
jgi:hypothetical protein